MSQSPLPEPCRVCGLHDWSVVRSLCMPCWNRSDFAVVERLAELAEQRGDFRTVDAIRQCLNHGHPSRRFVEFATRVVAEIEAQNTAADQMAVK